MESFESNGGSRLVVMDLSHIKQLVAQLEVHLGESPDLCKRLASQIFSLTERSIAVITSSSDFHGGRRKRSGADAGLQLASSVPPKTTNKKRRLTEKRKDQVRASSGGAGGGETPVVDDGHSWRKYGQKTIHGAKYPRSYYRCTHRHSQGCAATKQVQRSDEDPELFDVFYVGTHTCVHKTAATTQHSPDDAHGGPLQQSLSTGSMAVKTEDLALVAAGEELQGYCYCAPATTPLRTSFLAPEPERSAISALSMSPATSDSNHVACSLAPPLDAAKWRAGSELREVVSALVVASTTPPPPASVDVTDDELLDFDIASFFA